MWKKATIVFMLSFILVGCAGQTYFCVENGQYIVFQNCKLQ